jgi:hypothetical protein
MHDNGALAPLLGIIEGIQASLRGGDRSAQQDSFTGGGGRNTDKTRPSGQKRAGDECLFNSRAP